MLEIIDPRGEVFLESSKTAPRLKALKDTTVALIDSTKPHADIVLDEIRKNLTEQGVKEFITIKKSSLSAPLSKNLLELALKANAAVLATYD